MHGVTSRKEKFEDSACVETCDIPCSNPESKVQSGPCSNPNLQYKLSYWGIF